MSTPPWEPPSSLMSYNLKSRNLKNPKTVYDQKYVFGIYYLGNLVFTDLLTNKRKNAGWKYYLGVVFA